MNLLRLKQIQYDLTLPGIDHRLDRACSQSETDLIKEKQFQLEKGGKNVIPWYATVGHMIKDAISNLEYEIEKDYEGIRINVKCDATVNYSTYMYGQDADGNRGEERTDAEVKIGEAHISTADGELEISHFDPNYDCILENVEDDIIEKDGERYEGD